MTDESHSAPDPADPDTEKPQGMSAQSKQVLTIGVGLFAMAFGIFAGSIPGFVLGVLSLIAAIWPKRD